MFDEQCTRVCRQHSVLLHVCTCTANFSIASRGNNRVAAKTRHKCIVPVAVTPCHATSALFLCAHCCLAVLIFHMCTSLSIVVKWPGQATNNFPLELLRGKGNTLKHRIDALSDAKCTKRFLMSANMKIQHPVLNNYQAVNLKHRFTRGFAAAAIDKLTDFWTKMGKFAITHHKFPLSVGILMDPCVLNSQGFERQADKDGVPLWRDGKHGHDLQCDMVSVLDARYFEHGLYKQVDAKPFTTATHWVHFARMVPFIKQIFVEIGEQFNTPDLATARLREIWRGDYDTQIATLSATLPYALQQNPMTMQQRVREQLDPVRTLLAALSSGPVALSMSVSEAMDKGAATDTASIAKSAEVGNVSKHIKDYEKLSKGEKLDLATSMSKAAAQEADETVQVQCYKQVEPQLRFAPAPSSDRTV